MKPDATVPIIVPTAVTHAAFFLVQKSPVVAGKILREADKHIRVSDAAAEAMIEIVGTISEKIAKDAAELAKHAGRKTVMGEDVRLACRKLGYIS